MSTAEYEQLLYFVSTRDASLVVRAAKGIGTDDAIIQVLCGRMKKQLALDISSASIGLS